MDYRAVVAVVCIVVIAAAMCVLGYYRGVAHQQRADASCPVISAQDVQQAFAGQIQVIAYSNASSCVFAAPTYAVVTISWQPDPQGKLFVINRRAVNTPLISLKGAVRASRLLKTNGVYFDAGGRMYVIDAYQDLPTAGVLRVASMVAGHR